MDSLGEDRAAQIAIVRARLQGKVRPLKAIGMKSYFRVVHDQVLSRGGEFSIPSRPMNPEDLASIKELFSTLLPGDREAILKRAIGEMCGNWHPAVVIELIEGLPIDTAGKAEIYNMLNADQRSSIELEKARQNPGYMPRFGDVDPETYDLVLQSNIKHLVEGKESRKVVEALFHFAKAQPGTDLADYLDEYLASRAAIANPRQFAQLATLVAGAQCSVAQHTALMDKLGAEGRAAFDSLFARLPYGTDIYLRD